MAGALDGAAFSVTRALFLGKFNALFSFLFGLGFTLQIARVESAGGSALVTYLRRLGALLLIGLAHFLLIWPGDILVVYALMGLVLLALRRVPDRVLLGLALLALVASALVPLLDAALTPSTTHMAAAGAADEEIFAHGSFAEVTRARGRFLWDMYARVLGPDGIASIGLEVLGTALLGCLAGRRRLFLGWMPPRRTVLRFLLVTLGSGGLAVVAWFTVRARHRPADEFAISVIYETQRPLLMIAYVCAVALALERPVVRAALSKLAPVGRMSLSTYLAQSLILTSLFYGYGLGLTGKVSPAGGMALAAAIYLVQMVASAAWLRRFERGPVEWVWRVATYGQGALAAR